MLRVRICNNDEFLPFQPAVKKEIQERIEVMMQQELTTYQRHDLLNLMVFQTDREYRAKICDWCYSMVDQYNIDREAVLSSWYFIDRFLCTHQKEYEPKFIKLLSMVALLLASKLSSPRRISMHYLSKLSQSEFSVDALSKMERLLLQTLKWNLHPPSAKAVIRELVGFLATTIDENSAKLVSKYAHFFAELSVYDTELARKQIMSIASAALLNALELTGLPKTHYSSIKRSLLNDFPRSITNDDIEFSQKMMWAVFCKTQECALTRALDKPLTKKRRHGTKSHSPVTITDNLPTCLPNTTMNHEFL
jgi:hypothetical protein